MRFTRWFYTVPLRLRSIFRPRQIEQELDEELRYHLDRQIEEHIAKGVSLEEARYAARDRWRRATERGVPRYAPREVD